MHSYTCSLAFPEHHHGPGSGLGTGAREPRCPCSGLAAEGGSPHPWVSIGSLSAGPTGGCPAPAVHPARPPERPPHVPRSAHAT